jgi:hypothetical protein
MRTSVRISGVYWDSSGLLSNKSHSVNLFSRLARPNSAFFPWNIKQVFLRIALNCFYRGLLSVLNDHGRFIEWKITGKIPFIGHIYVIQHRWRKRKIWWRYFAETHMTIVKNFLYVRSNVGERPAFCQYEDIHFIKWLSSDYCLFQHKLNGQFILQVAKVLSPQVLNVSSCLVCCCFSVAR